MLMSLQTLDWDDEMSSFFKIKHSCLPLIKSSSEVYGHVHADLPLAGIPIAGILVLISLCHIVLKMWI